MSGAPGSLSDDMEPHLFLIMAILPVILCGGSGTRLWPLSHQSYPKQFVPLFGGRSLLQITAESVALQGPELMVVASETHRFQIKQGRGIKTSRPSN